MHAGHITVAIARRIHFNQGLLVPECVVDCNAWKCEPAYYGYGPRYQADVMWVTGDNYATEFEIKTSRSDWRADSDKRKWTMLPAFIARFIYVVPAKLGIPDFIHPKAGVWHVADDGRVKVVRAPKRIGKEKVPAWLVEKWRSHLYDRYWRQHIRHAPRLTPPPEGRDS